MPVLAPPNAAHFDANQVPSQMGVIGTLGTADTQGTALPLPMSIDPATGAQHVNVINGTVTASITLNTGTITTIVAGTQNTLGTVGIVNSGTITQSGFLYSNFAAAGTTTVKSGTGVLHSFVINSKSVGGVGTLFESAGTSANVIAAIDTTLSTTAFIYDASFGSLTFAWAGNTGGNVTITYR